MLVWRWCMLRAAGHRLVTATMSFLWSVYGHANAVSPPSHQRVDGLRVSLGRPTRRRQAHAKSGAAVSAASGASDEDLVGEMERLCVTLQTCLVASAWVTMTVVTVG
jgi:hypothetical protein